MRNILKLIAFSYLQIYDRECHFCQTLTPLSEGLLSTTPQLPITLHNLQEKLSHRRILLYQPHLRESRALLYSLYTTPHLRCFSFSKNKTHEINRVFCLVGRTGFEPVKAQGRLIYSQMRLTASLPTHDSWSRCAGSNRRPSPYHGDALPTELQRQVKYYLLY